MDPTTFTAIVAVGIVGGFISTTILAFIWPNEPIDDDNEQDS